MLYKPLTEENQAIRRSGVGASESSSLFGMNPYEGVIELWKRKIDSRREKGFSGILMWGNLHEPAIAWAYARETGKKLRRCGRTIRHRDHYRMVCTPDYKITGQRVNIQIKTSRHGDEWGEEWTDEIPPLYLVQVQHEMEILNYDMTHIPVLIGGNDFRIYQVERDWEFGQIIADSIDEFWGKVETEEAPLPLTTLDFKIISPEAGSTVLANDDQLCSWMKLKEVNIETTALVKLKEQLQDELKMAIGDSEAIIDGSGRVLATWKEYSRKDGTYRRFGVKA